MFLTNKFKVPTSKSKVIYFGINFTLVGRQIADVGSQIFQFFAIKSVTFA